MVALHLHTPLIHSPELSRQSGWSVSRSLSLVLVPGRRPSLLSADEGASSRVFLKLENTQPSGSFKCRGIGNLVVQLLAQHGDKTILVCSSGGNAGLACAYAARQLGVKTTIFVPVTTKPFVVHRLQAYGAEVMQGGAMWSEANDRALSFVRETDGAAYVHPFDHDAVVEGHATMVPEILQDLESLGVHRLDAISCSVGGGGLLAGLLRGLKTSHAGDVTVLAAETEGAASLALSLRASYSHNPPELDLRRLSDIKTVATSLGSTYVSETCLRLCLEHGNVVSVVMADGHAIRTSHSFADQHGFFVEPACAASIVPLSSPSLLRSALKRPDMEPGLSIDTDAPVIVIIVCGGNTSTLDQQRAWEREWSGKDIGKLHLLIGTTDEIH